ncbi:MAG: ABC transporter ATP-binding protein [Albidovulum sp.]
MDLSTITNGGASAPPVRPCGSLLRLEGLKKNFNAFTALADINLDVAAGEVHCLLGENGAGKSTLCNLVFGVYQPTEGTMLLDAKEYRPSSPRDALASGVAMVHQHFSLVSDLSVVDNLLMGQARWFLRRNEFARRVKDISEKYGLSVDPRAIISELSVGERQRVEIIKCLMREPKLLVLDEPTAVLLPDEIEKLLIVCKRVADEGCSVVLVTHKLAEIKRAADCVTVLRHGRVVDRSNDPSGDIDSLVRAMIGRDRMPLENASRADRLHVRTSGKEQLQIEGLNYRDAEGVQRLKDINLNVLAGEIVGIAGVEGNGQSELGAILAGMTQITSGRYRVAGQDLTNRPPFDVTAAGVGIVPEDRHNVGCVLGMSLADNLYLNELSRFSFHGLLVHKKLLEAAHNRMEEFDIRATGPSVQFSDLSGGNQQKAVLARELGLENLKLLIASQPTRGLDVGAVEAIYRQISMSAERGTGVLLISSELDELLSVADRIVVMYGGRIVGECPAAPENREVIGAMMAGQTK